jgi:hypothetical protein
MSDKSLPPSTATGRDDATAPRRWPRWVVRIVIVAGFCVLTFIGLVAGMVAFEIQSLPDTPPAVEINLDEVLGRAPAAASATSPPPPAALDASTSSTAPATDEELRYPPFVPDADDQPERLRENREDLNRRFDDIRTRIAAYEAEKTSLTLEQKIARREAIEEAYSDTFMQVLHPLEYKLSNDGSWGQRILEQNQAWVEWRWTTFIGHLEEADEYYKAARVTEIFSRDQYFTWESDHWADNPMTAPDRSRFEQQQGQLLWRQEAANLRREGGIDGYGRLTLRVVQRAFDRLENRIQRAEMHVRQGSDH